MLKLFKSTKIMYWLMCIVGGIVIFLVSPLISNRYLPFYLAFAWVIVSALICGLLATKKMNKITALMTEECNIKEFIFAYNDLFKKDCSDKVRKFLLLNLSSGYLSFGDTNSAKQMLDITRRYPERRANSPNILCWYNNLTSFYLQVKDIDSASACLKDFKLALENPKLNKKIREIYLNLYNQKEFLLNIQKGIYDGAEDFFNIVFQNDKKKLGKVFTKYTLGKIYLHNNEKDKAVEAFTYVQNNGGDSYYVESARQYMNNLNQ